MERRCKFRRDSGSCRRGEIAGARIPDGVDLVVNVVDSSGNLVRTDFCCGAGRNQTSIQKECDGYRPNIKPITAETLKRKKR